MDVAMLFEARGSLETLATIFAGIQSVLAFAGLAGVRAIGMATCRRSVDDHVTPVEHSKKETDFSPAALFLARKLSSNDVHS